MKMQNMKLQEERWTDAENFSMEESKHAIINSMEKDFEKCEISR